MFKKTKSNYKIIKLLLAIERAEKAYSFYLISRKYFNAIRIRNANILIYKILEDILIDDNYSMKHEIINYLFHLDDWFAQFEETYKINSPLLEDLFFFQRKDDMFSYPKDFIEKKLKLKI